jgi:hypothetical protein
MITVYFKIRSCITFVLLALVLLGLSTAACALSSSEAYHVNENWLLIDSKTSTLSVMRGNKIVQHFADVAFGRLGTKPLHFLNDSSTPTGQFRIDGINRKSRYVIFFSLNYPSIAHAKLALDSKRLSVEDYMAIFNAEIQGRKPPYTTPLGGMIGIHGLGAASLAVHQKYNWTRGCVALTNPQIRILEKYVRVGMRVTIQ